MITAPFNFVPLSEKVFFPPWAEEVSHDIPFEDSQSGSIDITITAKSPIFIRDGVDEEKFCSHNGAFYIPSSSVKGMVRSVLEIMSFGKILTDTKKFSQNMSVRDMSNTAQLVGVANGCGFLKQDESGKWFIEDYGKPRTIEYTNIEKKSLNVNNQTHSFTTGVNNENMSAQEKYALVDSNYPLIRVNKDIEDLLDRNNNKIGTKQIATIAQSGEEAYLILTGEITNKTHEFVFASNDKKENSIKDIEDAVAKFKTVYFNQESIDGNFWQHKYNPSIGIPIFYRKKDDKYDIGLTQLFKILYPNTIQSATKQNLETVHANGVDRVKLDLAETIFGHADKESALKGRVFFSHFKADSNPAIFSKNLTLTLGGPKPSFYPTYISQNCQNDGKVQNNNYHTLMDNNSKIAGWKRYPIHYNKPHVQSVPVSDTTTTFNPIGSYGQNGAFNEFSFHGKLRYHNLKPQELGAILSALTFHNSSYNFYHNIGLAKSHGFGKIEIKVDIKKHINAMKNFEANMSLWSREKNQKDWLQTEQIKELFAMHFKDTNVDAKLKYLVLDPDKKINKFSDAKNMKINGIEKGRECLPKFSVLSNFSSVPNSLVDKQYFEDLKQKAEAEVQAQKEQEAFAIAINSELITTVERFIREYPNNQNISQLQDKVNTLKEKAEKDKFKKINEDAQKAFDGAISQKDKNTIKKYFQSFITKYEKDKVNQASDYILNLIALAKKELENVTSTKEKVSNQGLDFSNADDAKSIERAMKTVQNPSDDDKDLLEEAIKRVYPMFSNSENKKKKFNKSTKLMIKWLGQERFDRLIFLTYPIRRGQAVSLPFVFKWNQYQCIRIKGQRLGSAPTGSIIDTKTTYCYNI